MKHLITKTYHLGAMTPTQIAAQALQDIANAANNEKILIEIESRKHTTTLEVKEVDDVTNAPTYFKMANAYARRNHFGRATRVIPGDTYAILTAQSAGYRKTSTGDYVHKAYLRHFGWKNTYYQALECCVMIPRINPAPQRYYIINKISNRTELVLSGNLLDVQNYYHRHYDPLTFCLTDSATKEGAALPDLIIVTGV